MSDQATNTEPVQSNTNNTVLTQSDQVFDPKNPDPKPAVDPNAPKDPIPQDPRTPEQGIDTPLEYKDFEVPEGVKLEGGILDKFKEKAKSLNLSQKDAQEFVNLGSEIAKDAVDSIQNNFKELRNEWVEDLKGDKEFGGQKLDETIQKAQRVLRKYADSEFLDFLEAGMGDNAHLVKMLARIDSVLSEDVQNTGGPGKGDSRTHAQKIYGSNYGKN